MPPDQKGAGVTVDGKGQQGARALLDQSFLPKEQCTAEKGSARECGRTRGWRQGGGGAKKLYMAKKPGCGHNGEEREQCPRVSPHAEESV